MEQKRSLFEITEESPARCRRITHSCQPKQGNRRDAGSSLRSRQRHLSPFGGNATRAPGAVLPSRTKLRGFAVKGRVAMLLSAGSDRGFEVSLGWRRPAMSCVRRFGPRFQGLAMISSEGEPGRNASPRQACCQDRLQGGGAEKVVSNADKASPSAGTGLRCRHGRATEGLACGRPRVRSRPWRRLSPRADGEDRERRRSQLVLDGRRGLSCTRERDRQD
jgi:hypothetical protein